jgi:hypothetical protein
MEERAMRTILINRTGLLVASFTVLSGCTHDLYKTLQSNPQIANKDAATKLANGNFKGARDAYDTVLQTDGNNSEALLGWVIADLLMLPESSLASELLDRMNQPHFDLSNDVFGSAGLLARAADADRGDADLTVAFQSESGLSKDVSLETRGVRARIYPITTSRGTPAHTLFVSVRQRTGISVRFISLEINLEDPTIHMTGDPTPLAANSVIDLAQLNGTITIWEPLPSGGAIGASTSPLHGAVAFGLVPTPNDPRVELTFTQAVVPGYCSSQTCSSAYTIDGTVHGHIADTPMLDTRTLPFGVEFADTTSLATTVARTLLRASAFDAAFVSEKLRAIGDHLEDEDAKRLKVLASAADEDTFSFEVPQDLFRTKEPLHLNASDARLLLGLIELAAAALELEAQYRSLEGNLPDLAVSGGAAPSLSASRAYPNLAANLLARTETFDLTAFRARLGSALRAGRDAFSVPVHGAGVFMFQIPAAKKIFDDIAAGLDAIEKSIGADQPVTIPPAPLYQAFLRAFFEQPLDRDRLLMLAGLSELVSMDTPDHLKVNIDPFANDPEHTLGGVVRFPPNRGAPCTTASDCGSTSFVCDAAGTCQPDLPYMFTTDAWKASTEKDWPLFIDPVLRDVFDLDLL